MDFRLHPLAYSLAIAWIEIGSELPIEILDDNGNNMGVKNVRFVSNDHCIINDRDYLMFPKTDKDNGKFILDENGKVIIFIMITSSKRNSNIWP